jgi:hypothetical protein
MLQTDELMELLDPDLSRIASLHIVNLTTFVRHVVQTWILESHVILCRLKENGNLPWTETHRFDTVPGENSADVTEGHNDKGKEIVIGFSMNGAILQCTDS